MQIRSFFLNESGQIEQDLDPDRMRAAQDNADHLLWVDIYDPEREAGQFLSDQLNFHPLAVSDCVTVSHQPARAEDYGSHMFVIVHGIDYSSMEEHVETGRLSVFISHGLIVTHHRVPLIAIDSLADRATQDPAMLNRSASMFGYLIFDSLQGNVLPTLDHMAETAAGLEEIAIEAPGREVLRTILNLKRSTLRIQRTMAPQIRLFNRLSRGEFPLITNESAVYYRDLQDQIVQLDIINQGVRDSADNALSTYLSSVGIKQNETMRILAIVAAVFLPLSLVAGIYGMNFVNIPELELRWGYYAVLGFMASIGLGTFYWLYFRRISWRSGGGRLLRSVKPPIDQLGRIGGTAQSVTRTFTPRLPGLTPNEKRDDESRR